MSVWRLPCNLAVKGFPFKTSKSFSIMNTDYIYSIEELREILGIAIDLTEKYNFKDLKQKLEGLEK